MQQMTLDEVRERFGSRTERRQELLERFAEWIHVAVATGKLRHVWVYGSFITAKPGPDDLDILALFAADFDPAAQPASIRHWFQLDTLESVYALHLNFLTEAVHPGVLDALMEWLAGDERGNIHMVEVIT
jgi:hypothetical protein